MVRVANDAVWRQTGVLFLGSALLFLINNYFGFDNAITAGVIPRWQSLIHLHAGSVGWITLSLIGVAIWIFTGQREVSAGYVRGTQALVWLAVLVFAGYVISFGIAFGRTGGAFVLLPVFGTSAMLLIWVTAVFTLSQLRRQPVVTTVHLLVAGGLLVAAVGATMGVLLGLEYVLGQFLPLTGEDRIALHAAMMDTYLILVAGAIVEWFGHREPPPRWTWAGLVQAAAWVIAAILVPIAFFFNLLDVLLPPFVLLLLLGLGFFLGRIAWRAIGKGPRGAGVTPWGFFGAVWLVIYVGLFIALALNPGAPPRSFEIIFAHSGFVGMMTNLLLGVFSARTQDARRILPWGEPAAMWLLNLGLVVFVGLQIWTGSRLGAIVMGLGVVLGVVTMIARLLSGRPGTEVR